MNHVPDTFRRSPLALAILGILEAESMHPYGIQRRIKQWGKEDVVNVGQRTGLYKTIARLEQAGYVESEGTDRDPSYPERTSYRITRSGRALARRWIAEMISTPRNEYPEFPVALSFAPMLAPDELRELLTARRAALAARLAALEGGLDAVVDGHHLPRVTQLDQEFQRAVVAAELAWTDGLLADLADKRLSWSRDELQALVEQIGG